jgi:hypothetical protein
MAYPHGMYEVILDRLLVTTAEASGTHKLDSTGDKARWGPGYVPHLVKAITITLDAVPGDAGVVKGDKRPTFGSNTGRGDGDVFIVNLATTHLAGDVIYKALNVLLKPGEEVVVEVTDASASVVAAKIALLVEPSWEEAVNNTKMVKTT